MSNSRLIGVVAAIIALALVVFGVYHFRNKAPGPEPKPQAEQTQQAPETPKAEGEAAPGGEAEPSKSAEVPSFDVVRVEGTGEGVIAGRAAPGWTIKIESDGNTIAETKTDEEGAWTVVLDKPLAAGDHSLTLKAISPDGTSSLTAQQPVKVAVAEGSPPKPEGQGEAAKPTPVRFEDVQYEDAGPDGGKLKMAGTGDAGASILLYLDDQPLGQVTIGPDGAWSFEADAKIDSADHALRADLIQAGTGVVIGRTSAAFRRTEQAAASSQPQPVYPDGPPPPSMVPPAPTSAAPAEPVTTANQPQPVYPEGPPSGVAAPSTSVAEAGPSLSSQPQPVYPAETPSAETPAAAAPAEAPSAETPSAAASAETSQPQPVYPDGPPPPSTSSAPPAPAAPAEPVSTANQPQPVVPPQTPEPSTVIAETPGTATAPRAGPLVVFRSVDYKDTGAGSGKVKLSGTGEPGSRVLLFFDEAPLGEVTIGSDGTWSFEAEQKLETGEHIFRADRIDPATGTVAGRAQIGMARMEPKEEVAAQEPAPSAQPAAPAGEQVASEEAQPAPVVKKKQQHRPRVYTVRRGDTLWEIAEYYYGGGWRYRAIVRDNRRKIKNPHWIYPKQKFHIPPRG